MESGAARRRRRRLLADLPEDLPQARAALAAELRRGRANVHLNLAEFARRTFSSPASVSRWLNGHAVPTQEQAVKWAQVCGTDEDTMVWLWKAAAAAPPAGKEDTSDLTSDLAATESAIDKTSPTDQPRPLADRQHDKPRLPRPRYRRLSPRALAVTASGLALAAAAVTITVLAGEHRHHPGPNQAPHSGDVTLTAGPKSTVGNCEVLSGTSDLPPGRTIVLGQQNHSDPAKTIYLQPVNDWQHPEDLRKWTGSQYFGSGDSSVGQIFTIFVISMKAGVVRDAMLHRVADIWHVQRLPTTSEVKKTITVTRIAGTGACGK